MGLASPPACVGAEKPIRCKPFHNLDELELATFQWVAWGNSKRLHQSLGYRTPEQAETEYYQNQEAQAASL